MRHMHDGVNWVQLPECFTNVLSIINFFLLSNEVSIKTSTKYISKESWPSTLVVGGCCSICHHPSVL